ncbi:unnamed protein product [Sympodiomycopsis kandeliae]
MDRPPSSFISLSESRSWARRRRSNVKMRSGGITTSTLLVLLLTLLSASPVVALWPFPEKRFRYQGLIDAGTLGLNDVGSGIAAWGDWDGDQYLDAFILSDNRRTLQVRRWDHTSFAYEKNPIFEISPLSGHPIVNVVPADIDRDGHLDVLLMTKGKNQDTLGMEVWLGRGVVGGGVDPKPKMVQSSTLAQPMLLDATADMQMDLLGFPVGNSTADRKTMQMWENILGQGERKAEQSSNDAFKISPAPLRSDSASPDDRLPCELADPHSSAFIDFNGDCMADLFLVCAPKGGESRQKFQIWTATRPDAQSSKNETNFNGFTFSRSGYLPPLAGSLSFADMNKDGTIDVVFTTCDMRSGECHINVAFNKQIGLCEKKASAAAGSVDSPVKDWSQSWKDWWRGGNGNDGEKSPGENMERCRRTEELCVADNQFVLDFEEKSLLRVPLSSMLPGHMPLIMDTLTESSSDSPQPISLALGDYDKDGYPDILFLSVPPGEPSDGSGKTGVHILRNVGCGSLSDDRIRDQCRKSSTLGGADTDDQGRWLILNKVSTEVLDRVEDARSASWVDIDEDGSLDIVLQRGRRSDHGVRSITFVQNNYFFDAFFLKVLTLNGACGSICEETFQASDHQNLSEVQGGETFVNRYKPWGAALPGASYKFTVLDPNGNRRAQQVGQQYQSTYRSLLTPYSYFGLGRTNNYVETLFVGSTLHPSISDEETYYISMEGVIPNSQVVISPTNQYTWHKELYLQPGDWIPWVTVVLLTLIIALCGVVFVLHLNEKREDEMERKRAVHAINFDALG